MGEVHRKGGWEETHAPTLRNVSPLHSSTQSIPVTPLFSPAREDIQALSWRSGSFIGWFLSVFPASGTIRFRDLLLGCFQNTQPSSHLHTFAQAPPTLTTSRTTAPFQFQLESLWLWRSQAPSLLYIPHLPSLLPPSVPFNVGPLEGRNHGWLFPGYPVPSTGLAHSGNSVNAEHTSR